MDEIDSVILKKLMDKARVTYRELAEMIDLSVSTIHKRIKALVDDEIIEGFTARPSIIALRSMRIMIFGTSKAKSIDQLCNELGEHENIDFIGVSGGKLKFKI